MVKTPKDRIRAAAAKRERGRALIEEANRELVAAFEDAIAAGSSADDAAALAGMTRQNVYALRKRAGR